MPPPSRHLIPQRRRIFLGCEGRSELAYGAWLHEIADTIENLYIHINSYLPSTGGGDPLYLVEQCVAEIQRKEMQLGEYDWRGILLDGEHLNQNHNRSQTASALARQNEITLIFQNPNHECFLLHHLPGQESRNPPANRCLTELKTVWPEYEKPMTRQDLNRTLNLDSLQRICTVEPDLRTFLQAIGFPV